MSNWTSANVLQSQAGGRRLWHFSAKGDRFVLNSEKTLALSEAVPAAEAGKTWQSYFRPKLNVAWLPADKVFLRAVQLPGADAAELASMVELQLEKLSPLPVTHIVWSIYLMPPIEGKPDALRTVIVIIAARSYVEELLGELEGQGFLTDRIECPGLDQLLSAKLNGDGLWIFPGGGAEPALLVWHYGGVVHNIALLALPEGNERAPHLRASIEQTVWAGELEGWLTEPPKIRLVAGPAEAVDWKLLLHDVAANGVDVVAPQSPAELAARSAQRTGHNGATTNLLPPEYAKRYRSQLVDKLWMRLLSTMMGIYILILLGYFAALYELQYEDGKARTHMASLANSATNAMQDYEQIEILRKSQNLKYASLDCWRAVAENLQDSLTLDLFYFNGTGKLTLNGTGTTDQPDDIYKFHDGLRDILDASKNDRLFSEVVISSLANSGNKIVWKIDCTLNTKDVQ